MDPRKAIQAIEKNGALLVFPLDNAKEPASIWSQFYPKTPMRWEWDEDGDDRVAQLWHLRSELSTTRKVVYTKWFRGRATYFSKPVFTALLRALNPVTNFGDALKQRSGLGPVALQILKILEGESPLSTKELKRIAGLKGKANEAAFDRALKELWSRLLIVAFGEVDDGAFPSLAIGATSVLFEPLWQKALVLKGPEADAMLTEAFDAKNLFYKHFQKLRANLPQPTETKIKTGGLTQSTRKIPSEVRFEDLIRKRP